MAPPNSWDNVDKGAKRREKSREAARCRRQVESDIFNDICSSIPIPPKTLSQVDRSTTMRLLISFMKLREAVNTVKFDTQGIKSEAVDVVPDDEEYVNALNGFILILSQDCDVLYASNNINEYIGIKSLDMIGQNLFEYTHEGDHSELTKSLKCGSTDDVQSKSLFLRIKSTLMSSGRNVSMKSATYKVVKCEGVMHHCTEPSGAFTVLHCEPIPHPSNIETVLDSKTFLSQHSLDMKFTYCDSERVNELTGYSKEDLLEHSFFDFCHAGDIRVLEKSMQKLLKLGQISTPTYRMLARTGGYVWVLTEATAITNERNHQPSYIVCVNHVISDVMEPGLILSASQLNYAENSVPLLLDDEIELLSNQETLPEFHLKDSTDDIFHNITDLLFDELEVDSFNNMTEDIFDCDVMPSGELTENLAQNAPSIGDDFDFSQINFAELFGIDIGEGSEDGPTPVNNFREAQPTIVGDKHSPNMANTFDTCFSSEEKSNKLVLAGQTRDQNPPIPPCSQETNYPETNPCALPYTSGCQIFAVPRSRYDQVQESSLLKRKLSADCATTMDSDCGKLAKLAEEFAAYPENSFASRNIHDEEKQRRKERMAGKMKLPKYFPFETAGKVGNITYLPCNQGNTTALMKQLNQDSSALDQFADVDWVALAANV